MGPSRRGLLKGVQDEGAGVDAPTLRPDNHHFDGKGYHLQAGLAMVGNYLFQIIVPHILKS